MVDDAGAIAPACCRTNRIKHFVLARPDLHTSWEDPEALKLCVFALVVVWTLRQFHDRSLAESRGGHSVALGWMQTSWTRVSLLK